MMWSLSLSREAAMRIGLRAAVAMCLFAGCSEAPSAATEVVLFPTDSVAAYIESERVEQRLVGLGVGVVVDGRTAFLGGFGHADDATKVPFDPQVTRVRWASTSKTLTGVLAMRAVEAGKLDLDADIRTYFQAWPEGRGTTTRLLLTNLAGIQSDEGKVDPWPPVEQLHDPAVNTGFSWALSRWIHAPLAREPGTDFGYSTMGFNLAGAVIGASVAGSGGDADAGFLGLADAMFAGTAAKGIRPDRTVDPGSNRATGYLLLEDGSVATAGEKDVSWTAPGGGFISTVEQLAAYCGLVAGDALSVESRRVMWTAPTLVDGSTSYYGLGWGVGGRDDRPRVEHNGVVEKAQTRIVLYPNERLCIVAMTNTDTASARYPIDLTRITEGVEDRVRAGG
jgi:CubicO group peptidase (beta-lactamase class C family)